MILAANRRYYGAVPTLIFLDIVIWNSFKLLDVITNANTGAWYECTEIQIYGQEKLEPTGHDAPIFRIYYPGNRTIFRIKYNKS